MNLKYKPSEHRVIVKPGTRMLRDDIGHFQGAENPVLVVSSSDKGHF